MVVEFSIALGSVQGAQATNSIGFYRGKFSTYPPCVKNQLPCVLVERVGEQNQRSKQARLVIRREEEGT